MLWRNQPLPTHPNGMRFSVFDEAGDLLATNEYFSVGGGFIVNERTQGGFVRSFRVAEDRRLTSSVVQSTKTSTTEP